MKNLHYIRNTKTDESFDTMEMKFYPNTWEPEMEEDKDYLQSLIDENPEKFKDCEIETIETRTFE
jgi:ClpP class serine protease